MLASALHVPHKQGPNMTIPTRPSQAARPNRAPARVATAALLLAASLAHASDFRVQVRNNSAGGGPGDSGPLPVDTNEVNFNSTFEINAFAGRGGAGPVSYTNIRYNET
jgi:hypothetical protein